VISGGTGRWFHSSHEALISRELFVAVQTVRNRKPRARYPKQRHPFMDLLTAPAVVTR
jgi:hypothetical protein